MLTTEYMHGSHAVYKDGNLLGYIIKFIPGWAFHPLGSTAPILAYHRHWQNALPA